MKLGFKASVTAVAVMFVVAVVLAGCRAGGETAGTGDADENLAVVKLGIGTPLTQGAVALGEGIRNGAVLAIDDTADDLAAVGVRVEPFVVDDQGSPQMAVSVANQLASDASVIGVVGHLNSAVSIPASGVYHEAGIVMVSPASTNPQLTLQGYGNVFRTCAADTAQGRVAARFAYDELGFISAYVVDDSTAYGEGLADEFARAFEETGGLVIGREKTSHTDTDFAALVVEIGSENPDVIYYGGEYEAGARFARQAVEGGFAGSFFSGDGIFTPDFIDLVGAADAEGTVCTSLGVPPDRHPGSAEFRERFSAKFPGEQIQAYDAYAYDAAFVILKALLAVTKEHGAGFPASAEGRAAIVEAVAATDIEGITGSLSFDENGDTTNDAVALYVVRDGAWVPYE